MPELSRPLPAEDRLVLLPKNPGAFFVFWQFSAGRGGSSSAPRRWRPRSSCACCTPTTNAVASAHKAPWHAGRVYLPVPSQGRNYQAALYALRGGAWEKFLESNHGRGARRRRRGRRTGLRQPGIPQEGASMSSRATLMFLLHAHLPYVNHPQDSSFPRGELVLRGRGRNLRPHNFLLERLAAEGHTGPASPSPSPRRWGPCWRTRRWKPSCSSYLESRLELIEKELVRAQDEPGPAQDRKTLPETLRGRGRPDA